MTQSNADSEALLEQVAGLAREEQILVNRLELSGEAFAELRAAELDACVEEVVDHLPMTSSARAASLTMACGRRWLCSGLQGRASTRSAALLAAIAAAVLSLALWLRAQSAGVGTPVGKEPSATRGSWGPFDTRVSAGVPLPWQPGDAGWLCTDSFFVDCDWVGDGAAAAPVLRIDARPVIDNGGATLLRRIDARPFRGQRLRLVANVRVRDVVSWAGLWLRVDDAPAQQTLVRSSTSLPLGSTRDFEEYQVGANVPSEGESIVIGAALSGSGTLWLQNVTLEVLPEGVDLPAAKARNTPVPPMRRRPLRPVQIEPPVARSPGFEGRTRE